MQTDLIVISEYCYKSHIDPSFILLLEENGLIEIQHEGTEGYIVTAELRNLERYARWYYDLSINIEGIDAIRHMLERMDGLQSEINTLRKQLRLYGNGKFNEFEE